MLSARVRWGGVWADHGSVCARLCSMGVHLRQCFVIALLVHRPKLARVLFAAFALQDHLAAFSFVLCVWQMSRAHFLQLDKVCVLCTLRLAACCHVLLSGACAKWHGAARAAARLSNGMLILFALVSVASICLIMQALLPRAERLPPAPSLKRQRADDPRTPEYAAKVPGAPGMPTATLCARMCAALWLCCIRRQERSFRGGGAARHQTQAEHLV